MCAQFAGALRQENAKFDMRTGPGVRADVVMPDQSKTEQLCFVLRGRAGKRGNLMVPALQAGAREYGRERPLQIKARGKRRNLPGGKLPRKHAAELLREAFAHPAKRPVRRLR